MIQYRNVDNWKLINYQGHDIKEVHSSLGKVWPPTPSVYKWLATYTTGTSSAECDSTSAITSGEITKTKLIEVQIGECVTSIGDNAFKDYFNLKSCTIGSGVTSIGNQTFINCRSLTSITIPDSVTTIGNQTFKQCRGLTSVTIGSGITSIGAFAFQHCSGLTSITVNAITPPDLGYWGTRTFENTNDCPIYVPCESLSAYQTAWSTYANRITCIQPPTPTFDGKWLATYTGRTSSAECDATSSITNNEITVLDLVDVQIGSCVTTIGDMAFDYAYDLTSVTIPNSVTTIGKQAFQYCDGIPSITIPNSVTSIGIYAFNGCHALTSITLSSSITSIADSTFAYCSGLTSITIPDSVTSIGDDAFNRCSGLTNVTFGSGLTNLGNSTFENCLSLTSILIPSGVTNIGANSFYNCSGLTSITIESTTPPTLGSGAFAFTNDCPIYIPAQSVEAYKTSWSAYASRIQTIP